MRCSGGLALYVLAGCGGRDALPAEVDLTFVVDPGAAGDERYLCFGFDAALVADADLAGLALTAPSGPVSLHHVSLFAAPFAFADGPVACEAMPDGAVPLNVWGPGGRDLVLPEGLAVAVPDDTLRLVIQVHALRSDDGPIGEARVRLALRRDAVERAAWLPVRAPTPALRPHHREEATGACKIDGELQVVSTWPHMHRAGLEFHGTAVRGGIASSLVDVVPWSFDQQRTYPLDVALSPGDELHTHCVWLNPTDTTILPGPNIDQEMCGQSFIAWPAEAARCR